MQESPDLRGRRRRRQGVPRRADRVRDRRRGSPRSGSGSIPGSASARPSSTTSSCCAGSASCASSAGRSCVGTSRKSFIGKLTGREVDERLGGTIASNVLALRAGADVLRVHDVAEVRQARARWPRRSWSAAEAAGARLADPGRAQGAVRSRPVEAHRHGHAIRLGRGRGSRPLDLHPSRGQRGRAGGRAAARDRRRLRRPRLRRGAHRPPRRHGRLLGGVRHRRPRRHRAELPDARAPLPRDRRAADGAVRLRVGARSRRQARAPAAARGRGGRGRGRARAPGRPDEDDEETSERSRRYLGLGSNVGDREAPPSRRGRRRFASTGSRSRRSRPLYETEPVGEVARPARLPERRGSGAHRRSSPRSCSTSARRSRSSEGGCSAGRGTGRDRWTSTCCCSATSSSSTERLTLPHPEVTQPPLRARAAARARPGAGAPRRHAARRARWRLARTAAQRVELASGSLADAAARATPAAAPAAARPGKSGTARSAISPAGRPSIAGRRSSKVIARRRLAAIWRSAAFGGSAPSTPSAIQSSIRWSHPGSAARSAPHGLVVGAVHSVRRGHDRRRGLHRRGRSAPPAERPRRSCASAARSRFRTFQLIRRTAGWSTSSPQRSASSTATRSSAVGRVERRVGAQPIELLVRSRASR